MLGLAYFILGLGWLSVIRIMLPLYWENKEEKWRMCVGIFRLKHPSIKDGRSISAGWTDTTFKYEHKLVLVLSIQYWFIFALCQNTDTTFKYQRCLLGLAYFFLGLGWPSVIRIMLHLYWENKEEKWRMCVRIFWVLRHPSIKDGRSINAGWTDTAFKYEHKLVLVLSIQYWFIFALCQNTEIIIKYNL